MPPFSDHDVAIVVSSPAPASPPLEYEKPEGGHERGDSSSSVFSVLHAQQQQHEPPFYSRMRKRVSFLSHAEVYEIETTEEYTDQELDACWFTPDEYDEIVWKNQQTIRRASSQSLRRDDCMRGLESQLHEAYLKRRRIKDISICTVLNEQMKQRQLNKWDPEQLREVYQSIAEYSTAKAIETARFDALEAQAINLELVSDHEDRPLAPCWWLNPASWFIWHFVRSYFQPFRQNPWCPNRRPVNENGRRSRECRS